MSEAQQDGDWVFSEVGRTYPTAEDYKRGITGGYTSHVQMMWVPRDATYCFWLGKAGETRPEGTSNPARQGRADA